MRLARTGDMPRIRAILLDKPHLAMFPLSNLDNHAQMPERRMTFWIKDGPPDEVLSVSGGGVVMPFLPGGSLTAAHQALSGLPVTGLIGPREQVRGLQRLMRLTDAPMTLDADEPHYLLALDDLIVPAGAGRLAALGDAPEDAMLKWLEAYQLEALHTPPALARDRAEAGYASGLAQGNRRVLMEGDVPLAMTAFNAQLPDIVQIGGVYTPPGLRGRGHGRRVVALHLAEARARGVSHATLSAANLAASRAYEAIGFQQVGEWSFVLFDGPQDHG